MTRSAHGAAELATLLRASDRIAVVGHVDPDPDSIGSVLAVYRMCQNLGKQSVAITPDPVPASLHFLPGVAELVRPHEVASLRDYELWILDCGVERIGDLRDLLPGAHFVVNVDHHATNPGTGTYNWVDSSYAACALMVAELAEAAGVAFDQDMATLLYAGLAGDTGTFRFSNTSAKVLHTAAALVESGADPAYIASALYEQRTHGFLKLLGNVLAQAALACDGRVIYATVTDTDRRLAGVTREGSQGIIQFLRMVGDVSAAVLFDQVGPDEVRVQLRSGPKVDVARVAQSLGGGGHPRAAGCRITGDANEAQRQVFEHLSKALDERE